MQAAPPIYCLEYSKFSEHWLDRNSTDIGPMIVVAALLKVWGSQDSCVTNVSETLSNCALYKAIIPILQQTPTSNS